MNESLTNKQIAFMLFGLIVGYGVIGLPKGIVEKVGTEAWFAILIGTVISVFGVYIIAYLGYVHKNKTLYEYSQDLVGKTMTTMFIIPYLILFFVHLTYVVRMASELIKLTILIKTPTWIISLLFFLIVYYAVVKGLRVVARLCEFYGIIVIVSYLFIHMLMFTQGKLVNIRPFWGTADIKSLLQTLPTMATPFIGIEIISFIPISEKNGKRVIRDSALAVGLIGLLYVLVVESCMFVIGPDDIVHYKDAVIATIRRIEIPYLEFFRRLDGIFINTWVMSVFCTVVIYAYGTIFFISKYLKKTSFNTLSIIVMVIAFIASQIPKTVFEVERILKYNGYFSIIPIIVIPLILFVITKVKKYDKKA
ncbi:GerAB/ArcD/ProY family transporter [Clostridium ganghwense]|uniref:GerAB/ArcD/ProY family transporter n=1 Tax=Clostridium ganghwense TaxID=312089 RepID=A0ABT4CJK4_9CLOT|nr:GerAB/ArcD/ProY family transporter [Clostridium ganghwense]MCY6369233.1 GerAB/ArcD/ProY family transporter [Clostridium ganghwense]